MRPRDWLLLAIGQGLEPIQIQKIMFKFAMEAGAPSSSQYRFEPYNWGPCSFEIYRDLAELRNEGLSSAQPSGRGWNSYHLTDEGVRQASKLKTKANPGLLTALQEVRDYVVSRSFRRLIRDIYKQYPRYAERSLFGT